MFWFVAMSSPSDQYQQIYVQLDLTLTFNIFSTLCEQKQVLRLEEAEVASHLFFLLSFDMPILLLDLKWLRYTIIFPLPYFSDKM